MKRVTLSLAAALILLSAVAAPAADELANYPVRWEHGGGTDFGRLEITTAALIFRGDEGEVKTLPFLYLDEVRIVDGIWIQARSNRETGISFGLNDVYNFGVVGETPDATIIDRVNRLITGAKEVRVKTAAKIPGERSRYMVSKGETLGDDVGLLIITDDKLYYRSDTGGKDHAWSYGDLRAIEVDKEGNLHVRTSERSLIKVGLSYRNYRFVSETGPFSGEDIGFLIDKVREAHEN